MQISEKIGQEKREKNVSILQPNRWEEIMKKSIKSGNDLGLSTIFMERLYKAIHQESIKIQEKIISQ